jgi:hypothetical protein
VSNGGPVTWNFKLLSHHLLDGFGGMGEGMSIQIAPDGRRILWLAHESAPKNFTAVDVSDPRKPKVVVPDRPAAGAHALELARDLRQHHGGRLPDPEEGLQPAGMELFDISVPEKPKSISFFDCSGDLARRAPALVLRRRIRPQRLGAPTSSRRIRTTTSSIAASTCAIPSKPVEIGRWHMPGTKQGDNVMPPPRHPLDKGYRAHNCNVYPQRPDRCYLAYIDGGMFVLDISDKANPKRISSWTNSPPYTGFMHTVVPLFDRGLMLVTDESTENNAKDWPKLIWVLDARDETNLVPISTCPLPDHKAFAARGRFGAHNIHENVPLPTCWQSDQIVLGTFFNGGCAPTTSPTRTSRSRSACSCRRRPPWRPTGTIQLNDVFVDEREIVYTVDRHVGGPLHPGDGFFEEDRVPGAAQHEALFARSGGAADPGPSRTPPLRRSGSAVQAATFVGAAPRHGYTSTNPCSICFLPATLARSGEGSSARAGARIPVTVVTGFLGAGKTTLVRRFLRRPRARHRRRHQRVRQRRHRRRAACAAPATR